MPPGGWVGGWRQGDWLRAAMAPFSRSVVAVLVDAAAFDLGVALALHTHDLVVQVAHQLLWFGFRLHWTVLSRVVVTVHVAVASNNSRLQFLVVYTSFVPSIWLLQI